MTNAYVYVDDLWEKHALFAGLIMNNNNTYHYHVLMYQMGNTLSKIRHLVKSCVLKKDSNWIDNFSLTHVIDQACNHGNYLAHY